MWFLGLKNSYNLHSTKTKLSWKVKVILADGHDRQTEIPKLVLHINTERNKLITFITKLNKFNTNAVYIKKCAE